MLDSLRNEYDDVVIPGMLSGTRVITGPGGSSSSSYNYLSPLVITKGAWQLGYVNKDWRSREANGLDATSPYKRRVVTPRARLQRVTVNERWDLVTTVSSGGTGRFLYDPYTYAFFGDRPDVRDRAIKRLNSKLQDSAGMMQLMPPLVELRELSDTFKFLRGSALNFLEALAHIKKTKGRSAVKFAAEAWLNWSFAISPTLSDIDDAVTSMNKYLEGHPSDQLKAEAGASFDWVSSDRFYQGFYGGNIPVVATTSHKIRYKAQAGVHCNLSSSVGREAQQHFGLGLDQFVPSLWELLPFSWLVDYFSTMGDFITDVFVANLFKVDYCTVTKKYTCLIQFQPSPPSGGYITSASITGGNSVIEVLDLVRTTSTVIPPRELRFKLPNEIAKDTETGVKKILNLVSVLVSGGSGIARHG